MKEKDIRLCMELCERAEDGNGKNFRNSSAVSVWKDQDCIAGGQGVSETGTG